MANLIASPELDGNLSLGVFGNWGSGKSFFMRRLRGAIDELTARARRASESDEFARPAYWPNVVQAEFNAWHYVDSNLWASLVSHLLQELRRFKPTLQNEAVATPLNVALNQLQIAADARDAATSHQTAATSARDAAENALKAAEADVEHAIASLAKESARSLWEVVDTEFSPERKGVVEQLEALGMTIDNANTTLKPVYTQLKELTSTGGRLQALASDLLRSRGTRRQLWLLAAMVVGPLVALALLSKSDTLAWLRDGATWLATTLVSLAAAVVQGADWLRGSAAALQKKLAPLNSVRLRIESALERAQASKGEQIVKLEKSLASKEAALAAARANAVAREQELQLAVEAVKDAVSGRTITRFIEQRLASSDYQKHLGLIAIIRNDFERLSQLISGYNAQRLDLKDKEHEIRDALRRAATGSLENIDSSFANLGVNRIVLYIDDLDRCPSERVVEVLQAIHLLLAFPVFVVIVGVDARWMAHALAKEYPTLLAHGSERSSSGAGDSLRPSAVTPSDYLEKIFQIPYWVPPLTTLSTNSLLDQLMLGDPQVFVRRTQDDHPVLSSSSNDNSSQDTESSSSMAIPHGRETSDSGNGAQHRRNSKASHQNPSAADPTVLTPPVVLHLNAEERAAMHALATIIGRSPRATKRFVNSYRLLKASLTTADRQEFGIEDDRLGGLATPMLMLAVVTGAPSLAAGFLSLPDGSTVDLLHHLSQLARGTNDGRHVASTLQRVLEFCDAEQGYWRTPVELPAARTWAIRVAQFSFEDLSTLRPATLE